MEFVERYSLYLSLSFSLVSFDTSPHFPVLFPPSRKFQKSQGPRTKGHCLGDDKHPPVCFGVLSREKFGRPPFWAVSFQPSLENDAVAFPRTAKSSPPSLLAPSDVVISVSSVGKVCPVQTSAGNLGEEREGGRGCNLADSSGSYNNDPTPTNYFVSR